MILPDDYIPNSIESYIHKLSQKTIAIYTSLALIVLLTLVLLPFIEIDITCDEPGIIRPYTEKAEIKSPITELVEKVFVNEGQNVHSGQILLRFRATSQEEDLAFRQKNLTTINNQIHDLTHLSKGRVPNSFKTEDRKYEYDFYISQIRHQEAAIKHAETEYARTLTLFQKKIVSQSEYEQYYYDLVSKKNELSTIRDNQMAKWAAELSAYHNRKTEESTLFLKSNENQRLYVIRSPVSGSLDYFPSIYEGALLYSGQTIGIVSPDSTLCAEVYVKPSNIGYISIGQKVKIQITSFNHTEWGYLDGVVESISSDYLTDSKGYTFFKVRCTMNQEYLVLKKTGRTGALKKGMNIIAHFVLTRQSLFNIIYKDIDEWINPQQSKISNNDSI